MKNAKVDRNATQVVGEVCQKTPNQTENTDFHLPNSSVFATLRTMSTMKSNQMNSAAIPMNAQIVCKAHSELLGLRSTHCIESCFVLLR